MDANEQQDWRRFRLIIWVAPALVLVASVLQASWTTAVPLAVLAAVLAALLVFRRGRKRAVTLHITIGLLVAFEALLLRATVDEPNIGIVWFLVVPAVVALLGSRSHILIWTPVTLGVIGYTWWLYADNPSMAHPMSLTNLIGATLVISAAALGIIAERERRERALVAACEAAREEARVREKAQRETSDAKTALTHFLGSMSHELRTPLTSIILSADMLEEVLTGSDHAVWPRNIRESAESLRLLVDDLLDLARSDAAQSVRDPRPFEIVDLIESVRSIVQPFAAARGQRLFVGAMPDVPVRWEGEADRIRQVLINLLHNGLQHGKGSCVWLLVQSDEGALRFEVGDDGRGIDPAYHREIFQPFARLPGGDDETPEGTGLGLAISQGYVASMESALELSSAPGEGAVFSFALDIGSLGEARLLARYPRGTAWPDRVNLIAPLDIARGWAAAWLGAWRIDVAPDGMPLGLDYNDSRPLGSISAFIEDLDRKAGQAATSDAPPEAPAAVAAKSLRVVVCDDDASILMALAARLEAAGHTVTCFDAPAVLLEHLEQAEVDVIVMDVNLGDASGMDALVSVRALPGGKGDTPVCMLSGRIDARERCLELGADAYLLKPSSGPELLETLQEITSRPRR